MTGVRDTGTGGETRERCRNCGGDAGDNHFDRSLCACGSMHHYCNGCGHALDDCSVSASGGPISDERLAEIAKRERNDTFTELGYGRAIRELLTEVARLRAVLTQQESALREITEQDQLDPDERAGAMRRIARSALAGVRSDG